MAKKPEDELIERLKEVFSIEDILDIYNKGLGQGKAHAIPSPKTLEVLDKLVKLNGESFENQKNDRNRIEKILIKIFYALIANAVLLVALIGSLAEKTS